MGVRLKSIAALHELTVEDMARGYRSGARAHVSS
jgi:hypothetical protein